MTGPGQGVGAPAILAIITGLPATGKRTLAAIIGRALRCPVFTKDDLERYLRRYFAAPPQAGAAAYAALEAMARFQLARAQPTVLTGVFSRDTHRQSALALARCYGAPFRPIECVCSDVTVHQQRVTQQVSDSPDWPPVTWAHVQEVREVYEPWTMPRLCIDSAAPLLGNIASALSYVTSATN